MGSSTRWLRDTTKSTVRLPYPHDHAPCSNLVVHHRYDLTRVTTSFAQGPVVRIAPNEVHLSNPDNYDRIYHMSSKFTKDPTHYHASGAADGMFGTVSNALHRRRRGPLNPFFSRRAVLDLQPIVRDKANRLCHLLRHDDDHQRPQAVDLYLAFRAVSIDVITEYAFGACWGFLERKDLGAAWNSQLKRAGMAFWTFQQFPLLRTLMLYLPAWLVRTVSGSAGAMRDARTVSLFSSSPSRRLDLGSC